MLFSSQSCSGSLLHKILRYICATSGLLAATTALANPPRASGPPIEGFTAGSMLAVLPAQTEATIIRSSIGMAVVLIVVATIYFLWKKSRRRRRIVPDRASVEVSAPMASIARPATSVPAISIQPKLRFSIHPKAPQQKNGVIAKKSLINGRNGHSLKNGSKRKRIFNYHKFYTEMVLQVSPATRADSFEGFPVEMNGHSHQIQLANGVNGTNGHANGNSVPAVNGHSQADDSAVKSANSQMIANQSAFIAEQKQLIAEQSKLIEEKSHLIAEKNQLLRRQSEMIDSNLL